MNPLDLHNKLRVIFQEHTTTQWKNGWQHEGDRLSKELTIQKNVPWNNLFLLDADYRGFYLDGPMGFKLEVKSESDDVIRIDIEDKQMFDTDIYYYIDNESDWLDQCDFLVDLCQRVYNAHIILREAISEVPKGFYGEANPKFATKFRRDRNIDEIIGN